MKQIDKHITNLNKTNNTLKTNHKQTTIYIYILFLYLSYFVFVLCCTPVLWHRRQYCMLYHLCRQSCLCHMPPFVFKFLSLNERPCCCECKTRVSREAAIPTFYVTCSCGSPRSLHSLGWLASLAWIGAPLTKNHDMPAVRTRMHRRVLVLGASPSIPPRAGFDAATWYIFKYHNMGNVFH